MPAVSFATDIKPLFRLVDVAHMKGHGVKLDDYAYMSDPSNDHENAERVQQSLSPQDDDPPSMPPGGPYWTADQLALFAKWRADGYQP
jgi:hypothetical protein